MFKPPLFICGYSGQQCCVKDVFSIFYFKIEGSYPSEGAGFNTHIYTLIHTYTLILVYSTRSFFWKTFDCFEKLNFSNDALKKYLLKNKNLKMQ